MTPITLDEQVSTLRLVLADTRRRLAIEAAINGSDIDPARRRKLDAMGAALATLEEVKRKADDGK